MREYLATLHTRPHHHKKRFALLVSGAITLSIFAVWLFVNYGAGAPAAPSAPKSGQAASLVQVKEMGPFESIGASVSSSFQAISEGFSALTQSWGGVSVQNGYQDMKAKTLNQYK